MGHCNAPVLVTEGGGGGDALAQAVERATPGEKVPGSIPNSPNFHKIRVISNPRNMK